MKILTVRSHFCCFGVFLVRSPQKIQVQAKISTIRLVFPDISTFLMTMHSLIQWIPGAYNSSPVFLNVLCKKYTIYNIHPWDTHCSLQNICFNRIALFSSFIYSFSKWRQICKIILSWNL